VPFSRTALGAHASASAQADAAAALDAIYARGVRFQTPDIARSRSHAGDPARLHRAMAKLLRGVRAAALPRPSSRLWGPNMPAGRSLAVIARLAARTRSLHHDYSQRVWLNSQASPSLC